MLSPNEAPAEAIRHVGVCCSGARDLPSQVRREGMEYQPRGSVALSVMDILALWAAFKTVVWILLTVLPFALYSLVWKRSPKFLLYRVKRRWYLGPPLCSSLWFDGFSRTLRAIRSGATGYRAMHHIYNWNEMRDDSGVNLDLGRWPGEALARWWIAMGNAQDELKKVADHVTLDVEQSGLAAAVHKFLI